MENSFYIQPFNEEFTSCWDEFVLNLSSNGNLFRTREFLFPSLCRSFFQMHQYLL